MVYISRYMSKGRRTLETVTRKEAIQNMPNDNLYPYDCKDKLDQKLRLNTTYLIVKAGN